MSWIDLKGKYGGSDNRSALNRAVRAEVVGGVLVLDAIAAIHDHFRRPKRDRDSRHDDAISETLTRLNEAAELMRESVMAEWGIGTNTKPRPQGPGFDREPLVGGREKRAFQSTAQRADSAVRPSNTSLQSTPVTGEPAISPSAAPASIPATRRDRQVVPAMGVRPVQTVGDAAYFAEQPRLSAAHTALLGTISDARVAAIAGKSETWICEERARLGIAAYRPRWTEDALKLLDTEPDNTAVANATGFSAGAVKVQRSRRKAARADAASPPPGTAG